MRTLQCFVVVALMIPASLLAEESVADEGERLVQAFVNDIVTMEGQFEQSLLDAEGEVLERTSGRLQIQRPGQFRWRYTEPYEQVLVADGLNIWSYDVDLAQVTVKAQAEALANTPALLLGGSEDALDQFSIDGTHQEAGTTWVRLTPKNTDSGFLGVELGFKHEQIYRMVFYDNLRQTTLVALYDVVVNTAFEAGEFDFEIPEDVDVVGTPAVAEPASP